MSNSDNELEKVLKPGAVKTSFVKLAYPLLSPGSWCFNPKEKKIF